MANAKLSTIDVLMSDFVLTPLACASLINEIFINLLYQKAQIPYTYNWLRNLVGKKRRDGDESNKINFTAKNYLRTVSLAHDTLENIMKSVREEFMSSEHPKEVVFVFGVTPFCPKEIFTVRFPSLARGHLENNHTIETNRNQHKVLREIFFSPVWMDMVTNSLPCTNTYVFVKRLTAKQSSHSDSVFAASKPLLVQPKVKHTVLNLNYIVAQSYSCCGLLKVYADEEHSTSASELIAQDKSTVITQETDGDEEFWLQSKVRFQGFKDCFINNVSACELW